MISLFRVIFWSLPTLPRYTLHLVYETFPFCSHSGRCQSVSLGKRIFEMPLVIGTRAKATVLCAGVTDLYAKLRNEANRQGFNVKDMPPDGDCALHAVIDQLHLERHRSTDEHTQTQHTVTTLGSSAVQLLMNHPVDSNFLNSSQFDSFHDYLKKTNYSWNMVRRVNTKACVRCS